MNSVKSILCFIVTLFNLFLLKLSSPLPRLINRKGEMGMDEADQFRMLFQKIAEMYELSPEVAAELLQKILDILSGRKKE